MKGILSGGSRRGSVLIVTLGLLVVLAVLAVAFARVSSLERDASNRHVWHTQARFAAEAGIEMAMSRLPDDYSQVLVDSGTPAWAYGNSPDTPIELATQPSYGRDSLGNWQQMTIGGRVFGYSGTVQPPPTLPIDPLGAQYVLKITDLQGHFNLNDDNPNLATILNALGAAVPRYTMQPDPIAGRGVQIVNFRNALQGGKFRSIQDLYQIPFLTMPQVDLLRQFVTIHGWQDRVLEPKPQGNAAYDTWDFNYRTVQRTPININTAPGPVLFALFRGLQARCLFPSGGTYALASSSPLDDAQAYRLADAILARRALSPPQPIVSLYDLADFLQTTLNGTYRWYMPIVMANCNPNAKLVKFNNDWSLNVYGIRAGGLNPNGGSTPICDKSDLLYYTTEVCFASFGRIEVESLGRIVDKGRREVLSSYKIRQVMKFWDVLRHDTQRDFEQNILGGPRRTRSFPENMPDQALNASRASALDGQIVLDDRRENMPPGTTWWTDNDTRMQHFSNMSGRWSGMRWTSGVRDVATPAAFRNADIRHNRPIYSSEAPSNQPQNPFDRGVLNEFLPASYRNSQYKSDLHPDGHWLNHYTDNRYRKQVYDSVDGDLPSQYGRAIYYPPEGAAEFWMKPDTRFRARDDALRGLLNVGTLASNANVPASYDWYGVPHCFSGIFNFGAGFGFPSSWRIENFRATGVYGTLSPSARKANDWSWPYGDWVYLGLTLMPNLSSMLEPMQWNHIRIQWDFYTSPWEAYINGQLGFRVYGGFYYGWGFATYGYNMTGRMQFGYMSYHTPKPSPPWDLDFRSTGTVDQIRMTRTFIANNTVVPNHYMPTNGWSYWNGQFQFPSNGKPIKLLSIRYTSYPGRDTFNRPNVSYTRLQWFANGSSGMTPDREYRLIRNPLQVPADAIDESIGPTDTLRYRVLFYDNGQRPFFQSPYVDDITVFYTTGFEILERIEGVV